ncbi:MAG: RNA polymerase factor sigma-54 [Deltaproteobacteria bacterium]|nr:RNA polymerase factor sigma-54 [Deltaproteobacteria bacterium]MBW2417660.1 RNA polymerase factor sigma-54 [Deltaproteobacteria bacterium]
MAIELKLQLKLSQQLVMTPQLQQAIKLLQLNRLELQNLVQQELTENPILEELEGEEEPTRAEIEDASPGEGPAEAEAEPAPGPESAEERSASGGEDLEVAADLTNVVADAEAPASGEEKEVSDAEKIADVEWENYMDANPQTGLESRGRDDDERRSLEATLTRRPSLGEHLEWQLQLSAFSADEREVAHWIIGNLNDDGYLCSTVEELSRQSGAPDELVETALAKLQLLDPPGVAARNLRECLLLQLDTLSIANPLVREIVSEHLDLLQKRDFRGLTRALGVGVEEVAVAAKVIGGLEPRPGRAFGGEDPIYITPDIYVYKVGDDFHIMLNEDGLPKLKVNSLYKDVLSREAGAPKDTKEYVQEKVRSALWLIKSIHQRQRTIYKVMESIIRYQREFFDRGINYLRPLNLRDVADDIEMHESTVSRVTTNKYVHTPQGIFELKYFFNSSIGRLSGEAIASESVKEKIRKIIANEDSRRPLSDQRIAEMLRVANIDIARRTVTKYRESMKLLSSTKRRQVG